MKTTAQEMAELDFAVAKAEGIDVRVFGHDPKPLRDLGIGGPVAAYQPTRDPAEAMRLMEKHGLSLSCMWKNTGWLVAINGKPSSTPAAR